MMVLIHHAVVVDYEPRSGIVSFQTLAVAVLAAASVVVE
jgi:hypothetical protein